MSSNPGSWHPTVVGYSRLVGVSDDRLLRVPSAIRSHDRELAQGGIAGAVTAMPSRSSSYAAVRGRIVSRQKGTGL
jgi:hypothetical protein